MRNGRSTWEKEYRENTAIPSSTRVAPSRALTMFSPLFPDNAATVVELGCGNGRNLSYLASQYHDATIIGVDFSSEAVEQARSNTQDVSNVSIVEADVLDWLTERSSDSVDFVVDSYFSQHLIEDDLFAEYVGGVATVLSAQGTVYWSGVGGSDEYYTQEARSVSSGVIEDPANGVQKRLYTADDVWGLFGDSLEASMVTTLHFEDEVEGGLYRRSVVAGCFDRT